MTDKEQYDVVIAGGGPAGSSAAIRLSAAGAKVLLLEQKEFPRAKLCGEFISPECVPHLEKLGVADDVEFSAAAKLSETVFFSQSGRSAPFKSEWLGSSSALGISRACFDEILLKRAVSSGCTVMNASAGSLIFDGAKAAGVTVKTPDKPAFEIFADKIIDATGRSRAIARQVAKTSPIRRAASIAFKAHVTGARIPSETCEIYSYKGGYGGCSRVEDGTFNLCFIIAASDVRRIGGDAETLLRNVVFKNARADEVLRNIKVETRWLAVTVDRFGPVDPAPAEGLFAIGDAGAFIDPFTGSGILMALESSEILTQILIAASGKLPEPHKAMSAYRKAYASAFERRLRMSSLLRKAAYSPWMAERAVSVMKVSERLRKTTARSTRSGR